MSLPRNSLIMVFGLSASWVCNANPMDAFLFSDLSGFDDFQSTAFVAEQSFWLENPELRIRPQQQQAESGDQNSTLYSLRFRPTSNHERRSRHRATSIDQALTQVEVETLLGSELNDRYQALVTLAEKESMLTLQDRLGEIYQSVINSKRALGNTSSSRDLAAAVLDLELANRKKQAVRQEVAILRADLIGHYLEVKTPASPLVTPKLISAADISRLTSNIVNHGVTTSPVYRRSRLKAQSVQSEVELLKSRTGFGLEMIEARFEADQQDSYSMTFGFRLPFARSTAARSGKERALALAEFESRRLERKLTADLNLHQRDIQLLFNNYQSRIEAATFIHERLRNQPEDAGVLAMLHRARLDAFDAATKLHIRMLRQYINLLELTGKLQQRPLSNWIKGNHHE